MSKIVAPTGYVDLDNDCEYSIDLKSTRSRESINPKEDLAFYFQTYLVPKYGLDNINVNNCASFMKELEMNWTILTPDLKDKVLDIIVDGIFTNDTSYDFKNKFISKLGANKLNPPNNIPVDTYKDTPGSKSTFGSVSNFGMSGNTIAFIVILSILIIGGLIYMFVVPKIMAKI